MAELMKFWAIAHSKTKQQQGRRWRNNFPVAKLSAQTDGKSSAAVSRFVSASYWS